MPQSFKPFPPRRKPQGSRPLADLVGGCIGPVLGKHGFGEADVLMHWPEIVGASLAEQCQPLRLQWRRRASGDREGTEPATLIVRVEGSSALMLQHMEAVVVDKVNTFLGWRCVGRLALRQGPLPVTPRRAPRPRPPDARDLAEARRLVGPVEEPGLADALARLGARVLAKAGQAPKK